VAIYLVAVAASRLLLAPDGTVAFWSPRIGLGLALVVLTGFRLWWALLGAVGLSTLVLGPAGSGPPVVESLTTIGVLAGSWLAFRLPAIRGNPTSRLALWTAAGLAIVAPVVQYALSALIQGGPIDWPIAERVVLAECAAALAIVPVALTNAHRFGALDPSARALRPAPEPARAADWALLAGIALLVSLIDVHPGTDEIRTSFLVMVPIALAGLRHGPRVVLATTLLTNLAYALAVTLLARLDPAPGYQSFLIGVNLVSLLVAAIAGARSRAAELSRERERIYRLVADNSTDVIVVIRSDGTCEYASPSTEAVLGWAPRQLVGGNLRPLIHEDDMDRSVRDFERSFADDQLPATTLRIRCADGSYRWVERTARAFIDPDEPETPKVVAVVRDITDRQHLEDSLRQSQKLESVGRLAGGIAHDFNNLLTAILGHSSLLQEDDRLPPDVIGQVDEMRRAAERAAGLTGQLLAFARRQVTVPQVVDLNALTASMQRLLERVLGEDIRLETQLGDDLGRVRIDPGQLEQVLLNLAVNARDAMPEGGRLTMRTSTRRSRTRTPFNPATGTGDHVAIAVTDTGQGIPPDTMARIFEPFFTTKVVGKGTGLGLSVCDGIVRQAGGRINVDSAVGRGTTFTIQLPIATDDSEAALPMVTPATVAGGEGESILVVEDEPQVLDLVVRVLTADGYRVLTASDGDEALALLAGRTDRVEALITDVRLPGMSGPRLAAVVRERYPAVRTLYMSGFEEAHEDALRAAWVPGAFLAKPFSPEMLRARIRELLDGSRPPAAPPALPPANLRPVAAR